MFYIKERDGVKILGIEEFERSGLVRAGFTTRVGGVSRGPFSELNMGLHVGDRIEDVIENRNRVISALGSSVERMVAADQVHGNRVYKAESSDAGKGSRSYSDTVKGYDALMTSDRGLLLSAYYADCAPIFLLDPENGAIALAHAGWRGTAQRIGPLTLERMSEEYGTDPRDCFAALGPTIRGCCYRVGHEVAGAVRGARSYHAYNAGRDEDDSNRDPNGRESLDLAAENRIQLEEAGLRTERIIIAPWCTSCRTDLFYSYRSEGGCTGRMAALLELF